MDLAGLFLTCEIALIYSIAVVGLFFTFKIIDFPDFTCEGSFTLGAITSLLCIKNGINPFLALIPSFIGGFIIGSITGFVTYKLKIDKFISSIIILSMLRPINLRIMGREPNIFLFDVATIFGDNAIGPLAIINIIIYGVVFLLLRSDLGTALRSMGQNQKLASRYGINVQVINTIGLGISNALIAFSGAIFGQYQKFFDIASGTGTLISSLAAIVIGLNILNFKNQRTQIFGCLLGSFFYRLIVFLGLNFDFLGFSTQDLDLITGLLTIVILGFSGNLGNKNV